SFQVKCPCSESFTARAKAWACHGSANTGPPASRGRAGRFSCSESESGWVKVIIPHIDVHRIQRGGLLAPKFARGKTHRINVLRILAKKMSVGIRKNESAVVSMDRSEFSARVPRQPRMPHRIDVAGAHLLAHFEARGHLYVTVCVNAIGERGRDLISGQRRGRSDRARRGHAALNLSS